MGFRIVALKDSPGVFQVEQADRDKGTLAGDRMASKSCARCGKPIAMDRYVLVNAAPIHLSCTKVF